VKKTDILYIFVAQNIHIVTCIHLYLIKVMSCKG